jgi:TM2 domain-containing membrane protein YozV
MAKKKAKKKAVKKKAIKRTAKKKTTRKPAMAVKPAKAKRKLTRPLAVVAFLLNVLVFLLPGIGSLIGGKTRQGVWQIILAGIGMILTLSLELQLLSLPLVLIAWIWGIVTGVEMLRESE